MKRILCATVPLTSRIAPVFGAILLLIGLIASTELHLGGVAKADASAVPTVTTDKSDYAPGETVTITGSGWIPGQPVALHIDESDGDLPWDATVIPDAAGNFSNSEFVIQTHDIGVLFTLTATQGSLSAMTEFTDVVSSGDAPNGDPGDFEIQGNVLATASGGHTDWLANGSGTTGLLTNAGVPLNSVVTFERHDAATGTGNTADDIFAGSNKTGDDPNTYTWKTGTANAKDDLNNVYVHISTDANGDRWITASADRASNNGTAFVDFELNQATLSQIADAGCSSPPCGHFSTNPLNASTGGRTPNDLLVTMQYNTGGSKATIIIYQWKLVSGQYQWFDITSSIPSTCGPLHNQSCAYVATNVVDGVSVPYGAFGLTSYLMNQFVEASLDVSSLIKAAIDPCAGIEVRTIFVKTKVSTAATASLDDFVTPISLSFNAGFTITPTSTPVKCSGGSDGTVTVSADGGTAPYTVTLDGGSPQTIAANGGSVIFTGLSVGTYSVHVVATGGCSKDKTIDVTQPAVLGSSISSQTNVSCHGGSDGSVTVAGSGGTIPYTYSIDGADFQSNGTFGNLSAGNYTVTVKDANGCTQVQPVTITEPATAISASETASPASCNGGSDGSVTVNVSGGTAPYSVTVNGVTHTNVTTSTTFTGLASGTYPASITDAHGCSGSATGVLVDQPTAISALETTAPASCHGVSDGSVTVSVSGGAAPYSVTVNGVTHTGVTGSTTFTGLASGTYAASITDAHGCSGSATGVLVDQPAAISASETTSPASCNGGSDGSVTVNVNGGSAPYSVTINGVTHTGVTRSTTFTGLASGTYAAGITDAHGCSGSAAGVLVDQAAAINASETTAPASCHGANDGSVTVSVSGGTAPYSVTVNGVTHSGITSSTTFTGLASGTYPASITDAHGCSGAATGVLVDQPAAISALETTAPASCHGGSDGSVTVTISGGSAPFSVTVNGVTHTGVTGSTTFTGLASGTYSASITDAHGCPGSATGVLVDQPAAISASETTSPASCNGGSDGSVSVAVSGGTAPYSVTVNGVTHTGITSSTTFTGLASGTYPATITDAHDCSGSATGVLVDQPAAISASETTAPASCHGGNDGSVTVSVSGGNAPYSVTVNGVTHTGITSSTTFTGLSSGTYLASITDAHGCSGSATGVLVDQPAAINASETTAPASCHGANDGSVTVSVSGGTAPYSVTVNGVTHTNVTTSTTFTGLASGIYPASLTDAHGCSGSATGVLVDQPAAISASETTSPASCHGGNDGSVTVAISGGTAPYSVTVNGVTHTGVSGSTTFTGLSSGTYPASITDAHGCSGSATGVLVDQPEAISASETTSPASCNGSSDGSVTVAISGGTAPYSVTVNGVTHTGVSGSTTFTGLAAGTYAASITDAHDCSGSAAGVLVDQPAAISASETTAPASCHGGNDGSVTVSVSGGAAPYSVSVNGVTHTGVSTSTTFTGLASGTYSASITDAHGCSGSAAGVLVDEPAAISAVETTSPASCNGGSDGSIIVSVSGGTAPYSVTVNGVTHTGITSSTTFTGLSSGTYAASITDAHGCSGSATGVLVDQPAAISASETTSPASCNGGSDGSVTVNVSGGTAPYSVTVNGVTHTSVSGNTTFTGLGSGAYPASITDAHGCSGSATGVLVDQPEAISASESTSPVSCNGNNDGSVTVSVSGGTAPYSVTVDGVTHTGITSSTTFTGLASGTYAASITDAHGCSGSATGVLVDQPAPISASETTAPATCHGGNDGSVTVSVSGGTAPYSVTVNGVTHTAVTGSTTFTGLASGTYAVSITDAHGCSGSANGVLVDQPAAISASETTSPASCNGNNDGSVTVTVSGGTAPYSVTVNGVTHTGVSSSTTFTGLTSGTYPASITDAHGCSGSAAGVLVGQPSAITASALATNPSCNGGTGAITVTASGGTGTLTYSKDGINFQASNVFNGLADGSYTITVKDANGCTTTAGATITSPTPVTTSSNKVDPLCSSGLGSMTVAFSGGTPGYECSLDNGAFAACSSPATFDNLGAGSHTVTVRDSHGCTGAVQTQTIVVPQALSPSVQTTPPSAFNTSDGTMTVSVSGGVAPYSVTVNNVTHTISTPGGSTTFTGLAAGDYPIIIVDANGCGIGIAATVPVAPVTVEAHLCSILSSIGTGGKTVFMVTLPGGALSQPLTIFYKMSGTAVLGADYSLSGTFGQITVPAGKTSATVTITALKNKGRKSNRTAIMTIVNGPGYFTTSGVNIATVIIRK